MADAPLPTTRVWVAGDTTLDVVYEDPPGRNRALGCLDMERMRICIRPGQPKVGAHQVLLHEIIHAVEQNMLAVGALDSELPEEFVKEFAGGLLPVLALSGLWPGLTREELKAFYDATTLDESDAKCEECGAYYPHHLTRNCKGEHVAPVR